MNMRRESQSGFSILEVLISLVVLSIGLLGIAGLQLNSLRATDSANHRSQATMYAYDILDKMHANRTKALAGSYNIAMSASAPTGTTIENVDLANWFNALDLLPSGDGSIALANGVVTVTVQWDDSRGQGSSTQQFQLSTAL